MCAVFAVDLYRIRACASVVAGAADVASTGLSVGSIAIREAEGPFGPRR